LASPTSLRLRETWIICFLLGIIMLNYPFIEIFNKQAYVLGMPMLVLYFMIGWPVSILVILFFTSSLRKEDSDPTDDSRNQT